MYIAHPSPLLQRLFAERPYQGVPPAEATFLFIGLDANYDARIEERAVFRKVCEYHEDAVTFWQTYEVHHPFLLPGYTGDGTLYHRSFARIGFRPEHAALVSFAELLHVPTTGRSNLVPEDLDCSHLTELNEAIMNGKAQHIFVTRGVARLMRRTQIFPWLRSAPIGRTNGLDVLFARNRKIVYSHLHFSVYGKFEAQKRKEAALIGSLMSPIQA